jgi:signal transduction histidine kinase
MTDHRRRPLAWRLSLAFAAVAFAAVALFGLLMVAITRADVNALGEQREQTTTAAIQRSLESWYRDHGTWTGADLRPALDLAANADARLQVVDGRGTRIAATEPAPKSGAAQPVAVVIDSARVGTALIEFRSSGLLPADQRLRSRLVTATAVVGGIAAALAVVVAVVVGRRITRPLQDLTRAVKAMERGDLEARVGTRSTAAELHELASGFDQMADALARQDQLRQALVADVAHELRTPVAVLQATCESILDGVTEPSVETARSMHEDVLRLKKSIEDLGTLTSAETAGLRLVRAPVDLSQVAKEAAEVHRQRFAAAGVTLSSELVPVVVHGDEARLFQIVSNLLVNAAKFTPSGGTVGLVVRPDGDAALIQVADTGVGIGVDELPHVFERFWRGRAAAGREGSGIGLAVVAELVRAHEGTVAVDSVADHGSTFTVRLPPGHGGNSKHLSPGLRVHGS